jgi:hypothetical protein
MSEQVHAPEHAAESYVPPEAAVAVAAVPFTERQIEQFDADDSDAGRTVGKILAYVFLYNVLAMLIVAWWICTRR